MGLNSSCIRYTRTNFHEFGFVAGPNNMCSYCKHGVSIQAFPYRHHTNNGGQSIARHKLDAVKSNSSCYTIYQQPDGHKEVLKYSTLQILMISCVGVWCLLLPAMTMNYWCCKSVCEQGLYVALWSVLES